MDTSSRSVGVAGVDKCFGDTVVLKSIDLEVGAGRSVALLGPSGCGKTTLLRLIAGLERPDAGTISVGETPVASGSTWVPPEKRNVGMVFQDWALFPHLTVAKNVAYGLDRSERNGPRVTEALDMVGLAHLGDRMPDTLSGGQQQRVALARAIAPRPSVLLLDEPFSNLDTSLRVGVRTEVHALLVELGITAVFVTHDQTEAFVLGDDVAVMRDGRIEQIGTPREIYQAPVSEWIAGFVGDVNLLPGAASGATASTALGELALTSPANGEVRVLVRPEELQLNIDGPHRIARVEYYGHDMMVTVALSDEVNPGTELQVRTPSNTAWREGDSVAVHFEGASATAFA